MTEGRFKTMFFTFAIAIIASLGALVSGTWTGWSSPANYLIKNNRTELRVCNYGLMVSMFDLGNIVSPIPTGVALSAFGRKTTIAVIGPLSVASWASILAWPSSLTVLYAARFTAGLAKGMTYSAIPMYVGEISEVKYRGAALSLFPILETTGMIAMQFIGQKLTYQRLNVFGLSFSLLFTLLFLIMPESPYYYVQKSRRDSAEKSLRKIRARDDVTDELNVVEQTVNMQMRDEATYAELFSNTANRRAFVIVAGACAAQRLSGISPFIHFSSITLPSKNAWMSPMMAVVFFTTAKSFGNVITMILVDRVGRKPLMLFSHSSMALFTATYAGSLYAVSHVANFGHYTWIPVIVLWMFGLSYALGAGCLGSSTLMGEMFAANVKTKAAPLCVMCLAGGSFFLDSIYTTVTDSIGDFANYVLYAAFDVTWAIAAAFVMIETKGKTFIEIQDELRS